MIKLLAVTLMTSLSFGAVISFNPVSQSVLLGEQAIVSVQSSDGYIGDYDFAVNFDPAILSLASVAFGTQLGAPANSIGGSVGAFGTVNVFEASFLSLSGLQTAQAGMTATLFTLTFNTLAEGLSALSITPTTLGNEEGADVLTDSRFNTGSIEVVQGITPGVPEPSTFLLIAPALIGIAIRLRRK